MNNKELYIDGISQIHFIGGMVRMDIFSLEPKPDAEPVQECNARLIMTPQGFLSAFAAMQQLADKLVDAGVLQKAPQ